MKLLPTKPTKVFSLDNTPIYDQMQDEIARKGKLSITQPTAPLPAHAVVKRNPLAIEAPRA